MAIALPIFGVILNHAKESWLKVGSVSVSSHHFNHMYRVQQDCVEFLFVHPKPSSVLQLRNRGDFTRLQQTEKAKRLVQSAASFIQRKL